jgi:hypothetical protein
MEHIYLCKELNSERIEVSYKQLFNGSINQQIRVYRRFQNNFDKRENMKNENKKEDIPHAIAQSEPQSSGIECCNGFNK